MRNCNPKMLLATLAAVGALTSSLPAQTAHAVYVTTGQNSVDRIDIYPSSNTAIVRFKNAMGYQSGNTHCGVGGAEPERRVSLDLNQNWGRAALSLVTAALLSGKSMSLSTTDTCLNGVFSWGWGTLLSS